MRECSSADGSAQCVLEELLVFLLCLKSSVYFETVTKSPALQTTLLPCQYKTSAPLSGHPSLPPPLCDG